MKSQWSLQRQILARYRELGIVGQLPGFQGNVPLVLKTIRGDANITGQGKTGWVDSLDPLFGEIADQWMRSLTDDFGTDHWYQLDGYFNGGTAPWLKSGIATDIRKSFSAGDFPVDNQWYARGAKAYEGLNRTDPRAVWSFQGFAVESWEEDSRHASWLKGFVEAVPAGRLSVIDMDYTYGEWTKWNGSAFFGAPFIWTALHNFGGTDGIRGNLSRVSDMPFAAREAGSAIWGTGFTPEGIDQNPAYYEQLLDQPWRTSRLPSMRDALITRAHRRYGLHTFSAAVAFAWGSLADSMYARDVSVQDTTGVAHLPGTRVGDWIERHLPTQDMCKTFDAWSALVTAALQVDAHLEPFRYDLVDTGRDVLARLSTPLSQNFTDAALPLGEHPPNAHQVASAGAVYIELLSDLDDLVGTDAAFLLGSWVSMARGLGVNSTDCNVPGIPSITSCADFYEWNARVQLTTWNPTMSGASRVPSGPVDYAAKHWNGLIRDFYKTRAMRLSHLAAEAAIQQLPVSTVAVERMKAQVAFEFQTDFGTKYAALPSGDAVELSRRMLAKYRHFFSTCQVQSSSSPESVAGGNVVLV